MPTPKPRLEPVVWRPPRRPARARARYSRTPLPLPRLLPLGGTGPEDVRYDAVTDRLLTGLADGRIVSVDPAGADVRTVAVTGGRPLGLCPLADGRILVCCADQGLLRVDPATGRKETVLREAGGKPLRVCSNAVAAPDGTLYVSDASRRFGLDHWMGDLLEHSGTGRLIRYEPGKPAEVVLDGLQFANGVALAPDASYVTVAETGAYRLRRLWLTGPKAGTDDVLLDNLPAFPDNLSTGPDGLIWVAMVAPRDPLADLLHRTHPGVRRALWALPPALMRGPRPTAWVVGVDPAGRVVHDLQRPGGGRRTGKRPAAGYRMVTSVCEHRGRLYLGSLVESSLAVVDLPAPRPA